MLDSGVQLHVVELAHGHRNWEVSEGPEHSRFVDYIQVRAKTLLWHKENMINIGLLHVPKSAKGIGWFDGDIHFEQTDWAIETLHALEQHPVIQPWSDAIDLGANGEVIKHHKSFAAQWMSGEPMGNISGGKYTFAHPGYAWAATPEFLTTTGGLIERAVLGAADHHMALAIIGEGEKSIKSGVTAGYRNMVMNWQERALHAAATNLGVVQNSTITHNFHGHKENRFYVDRWQIILRDHFDPDRDLVKNLDGVLELRHNKHKLTRDIIRYFWSRREDDAVL